MARSINGLRDLNAKVKGAPLPPLPPTFSYSGRFLGHNRRRPPEAGAQTRDSS